MIKDTNGRDITESEEVARIHRITIQKKKKKKKDLMTRKTTMMWSLT